MSETLGESEQIEGFEPPIEGVDDRYALVEAREEARREGRLLGNANQPNVILTPPPNVNALAEAINEGLRRQGRI
jgi:hypothetical protein